MATLRASEIFLDAGLTLIAVESIDCHHSKTDIGYHVYGNKKPIAIVVCRPEKTYALDMEARSISVEQLCENVPELGAILGKAL